MESARHADDRVTRAVGEQLVAPDEEIEAGHRLVHSLHNARAETVCLYEIDGRREVCASDLDRPGAFLGTLFDLREDSTAGDVIEERGGFSIPNEVNGGNRDVGQVERNDIHAKRPNDAECLLIVQACAAFEVIRDIAFKRRAQVPHAQSPGIGIRVPVEWHIDDGVVLAVASIDSVQHQSAILGRAANRTNGILRPGQHHSAVTAHTTKRRPQTGDTVST